MKRILRLCTALSAFFAVAIGVSACGSGVGGGNVASVAGNPISVKAFNHWMYVAQKGNASQEQGAPVIVPTDPPSFDGCIKQIKAQIPSLASTNQKTLKADCSQLFQSLAGQVLDFLIKGYWYQALGHAQGINVSNADLTKAFKQAQKQSFPTPADYKSFLAQTGETKADINFRLRVNQIFQKLLNRNTPKSNAAAIAAYYNKHKAQFGTPAQRNIRVVRTNSRGQAAAALAALRSGQSWKAVAKKYSVDAATKNNGGQLTGVTNGEEEQALNSAIFKAPKSKLLGPIHGTFGWYVAVVTKISPGAQQSLAKATPEIKLILQSQNQSTAQNKVNALAKKKYGSATKCASAYNVVNDCVGYKPPKTTTTTTPGGPATTSSGGNSSATVTSSGSANTGTAATGTTTH